MTTRPSTDVHSLARAYRRRATPASADDAWTITTRSHTDGTDDRTRELWIVVEALVATRVARGEAGQSIAWGPWGEVGHLSRDAVTLTALERSGMGSLGTDQGERALAALLGTGNGAIAVLANRWDRWRAGANPLEERSFAELVETPARPADESTAGAAPRLAELLRAGDAGGALELAVATVTAVVADVLGADPAPNQRLRDLGLDSLSAVQLRNGLVRSFDIGLPVDICLEYGTAGALAGHVLDRFRAAHAPTGPEGDAT